ncbi:hypothetical protein Kpol_530p19 [Vanderwaltozyma polyspora DSM 70294]|uniref:D-lactate dehydrogenase (cytochrome) n=1 Tax=Vanderwaltozyma polyspora (strain ATCC 22028 / DSM 70294 / BCRC 21397 / CBS 2163 / NBRC 10782 / NRRL Y-8283 / UCD 57-17) TaxID=436907 RepID=A7TKZ3_VANPO|nr:uncharacterized protein Kpol_530p19 [Vanderwaltozyma polyspora DSM 70294]EDO17049.1 hypothetical protein Kpol_530p19 [Vanderwaltozyma polyspora DSM 70294]
MFKLNRNSIYRGSLLLKHLKNQPKNKLCPPRFYATSNQPLKANKPNSKYWELINYTIIAFVGIAAVKLIISKEPKIEKTVTVYNSFNNDGSTLSLSDLKSPEYCTDPKKLKEVVSQLKQILDNDANHYSQTKSELDDHSDTYFNTHHPDKNQRPFIILYPRTTEDVSKIMKLCHDNEVPVIPYSGGTSLEGHYLPTRPNCCVVIDVSKYMSRIVTLHKDDLDVVVQAGLPWEDLNAYLNENGLLLGIDPGPGAQIGGCIADSCSGTNAYKYGTMKENIVNVTMVLPDGTVVKTKRRPRKSSAGYNLNGLIVGSEGTLGIVTEATLKCHVKPAIETVAVVSFPSVGHAAACASNITQSGIQLNAMELLDNDMMKLINVSGSTFRSDWPEFPTMFFKIGGRNQVIVDELISEVQTIAQKHQCKKFEFANDDDEKVELWQARKVALWTVIDSGKAINKNANVWTTDVAVPLSKFADVIEATKLDLKETNLLNAIVGHAGDGNFHSLIVYNGEEERAKCEDVVAKMVRRALENDGTCTGEHGVGVGKRDYLTEELDENTIDLMRNIKLAIDPKRIMNPDKIFKIDPNEPHLYK